MRRIRPEQTSAEEGWPDTAFFSPFGKRERALPAIGITLGVIEIKNFLATPTGFSGGGGKIWLGQLVEERCDVSVVNVLFDERFLSQSRHSVRELIFEGCDFH